LLAIKSLSNLHLPGSNKPMTLRWAEGEAERLGLFGVDKEN
jgi:hypothetical protein